MYVLRALHICLQKSNAKSYSKFVWIILKKYQQAKKEFCTGFDSPLQLKYILYTRTSGTIYLALFLSTITCIAMYTVQPKMIGDKSFVVGKKNRTYKHTNGTDRPTCGQTHVQTILKWGANLEWGKGTRSETKKINAIIRK